MKIKELKNYLIKKYNISGEYANNLIRQGILKSKDEKQFVIDFLLEKQRRQLFEKGKKEAYRKGKEFISKIKDDWLQDRLLDYKIDKIIKLITK